MTVRVVGGVWSCFELRTCDFAIRHNGRDIFGGLPDGKLGRLTIDPAATSERPVLFDLPAIEVQQDDAILFAFRTNGRVLSEPKYPGMGTFYGIRAAVIGLDKDWSLTRDFRPQINPDGAWSYGYNFKNTLSASRRRDRPPAVLVRPEDARARVGAVRARDPAAGLRHRARARLRLAPRPEPHHLRPPRRAVHDRRAVERRQIAAVRFLALTGNAFPAWASLLERYGMVRGTRANTHELMRGDHRGVPGRRAGSQQAPGREVPAHVEAARRVRTPGDRARLSDRAVRRRRRGGDARRRDRRGQSGLRQAQPGRREAGTGWPMQPIVRGVGPTPCRDLSASTSGSGRRSRRRISPGAPRSARRGLSAARSSGPSRKASRSCCTSARSTATADPAAERQPSTASSSFASTTRWICEEPS